MKNGKAGKSFKKTGKIEKCFYLDTNKARKHREGYWIDSVHMNTGTHTLSEYNPCSVSIYLVPGSTLTIDETIYTESAFCPKLAIAVYRM